MKSIKAIFRRGQNTKGEGQNLGDLSRASSVTNLDVEPKSGKGARPRKSSSRDRIDKLDKLGGDGRRNDKKGITRNNNKLDSGENPYPSVDSLSEEELLHLRRQLQEMAQEKTNLALQLGEQKGQLNILQKEIQKLKDESNIQLEHLTEENTALRNRLRDVAHSPLSDNEKQQLLFDSHRHHSSAPASIATNIIDDGNGPETACTTPDWDKHSSSNVSEVSVACLQDKINQMQETHYSTNEELQATLQELTDLQRQLTELQQENEKLNEEKTLMFDSLCRQTERLNDSRSEVESLKQLLYQEKDDTGQFESAVEREQKLVDLLKSAQEEREGLLVKLEQLNNELQESRSGIIEKDDQIGNLRDRVRTLECTLDAKHAEHKLLDQELAQAKDQCSGKQIEINRLTDLLDNARTKINELEQDRTLSDKSELDEMLDNARKEKDSLESEVAHLKEQLAIGKNEIEKLREQVSILQEECKVTRNNAKTTQSDLEYKCEKLVKDKNVLNEQLQEFQEALNELQVQSQCQLEDKRQLSAVLSETQRNLSEAERKNLALENEVEEIKRLRAEENEEWEKFQDDLLTSVRVANDFKTEAQQELQRMILENKSYRERERHLKAEIEKLKGGTLTTDANKENMDFLVKRPNRSKSKPRNNSGTLSSGSKTDKTAKTDKTTSLPQNKIDKTTKSDNTITLPQNVTVKRRENKSLKNKRLKTLSVEEEMLLGSLERYHADIDKNLPDEFLTEEEKVIKKLKIIYEDDFLNIKPVAPKPKDQLAISKPLLDSVLANPKLMAIIKNPKVKTIEDMATFEKEAPEIRKLIQDMDRSTKGKSDNFGRPEYTKRISIIGRSMSCDHVNEVQDTNSPLRLYRTPEAEDLTKDIPIRNRDSSSLVPSDSASNRIRYSDFSLVVNSNENIFEENVKYSTLERIARSIPKNAPEDSLTKEQKFAVKLLQALEERKHTVKKSEKAKTLPISTPTPESVLKNQRLKEIIYDPAIRAVRRKSETPTSPIIEKVLRESKSYENISFTFENRPHSVNVFRSSSESSSETFSSAEFNVETGQTGPYEPINTWSKPSGTPKIPKKMVLQSFKPQSEKRNTSKSKADLLKAELVELAQPYDKQKSNSIIDLYNEKLKELEASTHKKSRPDRKIYVDPNENVPKDGKIKVVHVVVETLPAQALHKEKKPKKPIEEKQNIEKTRSTGTDVASLYNEKRKVPTLEGDYKVDLLQEKIKKKTQKAPIALIDKTQHKGSQSEKEDRKAVKEHNKYKDENFEDKVNAQMSDPTKKKNIDKNERQVLINDVSIQNKDMRGTDDTDSLIYNETLTRVLKREISSEKGSSEPSDQPPSIDEAMKNITEKFEEIHKLITDDSVKVSNIEKNDLLVLEVLPPPKEFLKEENFQEVEFRHPDLISNTENAKVEARNSTIATLTLKSDDLSDDDSITHEKSNPDLPEQSPEYDYHAILKENRVGVTSPLNYRLSYRDVVHEFKKKFAENELEDESENLQETEDVDDHETTVEVRSRSASIDKEMEDILENYLHTRVSQLIKQTEGKPSKSAEDPVYTDFDRKLNDIVRSSFSHDNLGRTNLVEDSPELPDYHNLELLSVNSPMPTLQEIERDTNISKIITQENIQNISLPEKEAYSKQSISIELNNKSEIHPQTSEVPTHAVTEEVSNGILRTSFVYDRSTNLLIDAKMDTRELSEPTQIASSKNPVDEKVPEISAEEISEENKPVFTTESESPTLSFEESVQSISRTEPFTSELINQTESASPKANELPVYTDKDGRLIDMTETSFNETLDNVQPNTNLAVDKAMLLQEFPESNSAKNTAKNSFQIAAPKNLMNEKDIEASVKNFSNKNMSSKLSLESESSELSLGEKIEKANSTIHDYLNLAPTELTFSDDSYFELKNGNVKSVLAFKNNSIENEAEEFNRILITKSFLEDQRKVSSLDHFSINSDIKEQPKQRESLNIDIKPKVQGEKEFAYEPSAVDGSNEDNKAITQKPLNNGVLVDQVAPISDKKENKILTNPESTTFNISFNSEHSDESTNKTEKILKHEKTETKNASKNNSSLNETEIFTEEELEVVRRARSRRSPRLLSEFNEQDLELIQAISINYQEEPLKQENTTYLDTKKVLADEGSQKIENRFKNDIKTVEESPRPHSRLNLNQEDIDLIKKLTSTYSQETKTAIPENELEKKINKDTRHEDILPSKSELKTSNSKNFSNPEISRDILQKPTQYSLPAFNIETELPDDLDSLLTKMSSTRGRTRRKLQSVEIELNTDKVESEVIASDKTPLLESEGVKKESTDENDHIHSSENIEKSSDQDKRNKSIHSKDSECSLENSNDLLAASVADSEKVTELNKDLEADNKKAFKDEQVSYITDFKLDDTRKEVSIQKKPVETEIDTTSVYEVPELSENKSNIAEIGPTRDLHVVLLRNNRSERRNRNLTLPQSTSSTNNELNKNRFSLNLSAKEGEVEQKKEKRVKSFAQHFERLSQERSKFSLKKAEPITNLQTRRIPDVSSVDNIEKKPIPRPRLKNQGARDSAKPDNSSNIKNHEVIRKMSDYEENFSAADHKMVNEEDSGAFGPEVENRRKISMEVPDLQQFQNLVIDDFHSNSSDEGNSSDSLEEDRVKKSGKFRAEPNPLNADNFLESLDDKNQAKTSYSVIAIAGTAEQLDLRKSSNLTIEPSSLNLFNMDAPSLEENYIDASKPDFNRKKIVSYLNSSYLLEMSDADNFDNDQIFGAPTSSDSKPKIVDFVPLDEATKPYFKSNHIPDYSTLEREKTFQVLNAVSNLKVSDPRNEANRSANFRTESRTSFSAAKKIFQDLEAKSDQPGVTRVALTKKKSSELSDNSEAPRSESNKVRPDSKLESVAQVQQEIDEI